MRKYLIKTTKHTTFVPSAQILHLKANSFKQDNTPPMPLNDAHLGGLFFLGDG